MEQSYTSADLFIRDYLSPHAKNEAQPGLCREDEALNGSYPHLLDLDFCGTSNHVDTPTNAEDSNEDHGAATKFKR